MIHRTHLFTLAACLLFTLFALPAFAHEDVEHETAAEAEAHLQADPKLPMKPLDVIKARAQEIKQGAQGARIEWRADTKANVQAAPPGERKGALKDAWDERKNIAQERMASTTRLARSVKALVLTHGGVIKNRFRLAIGHLTNLLERMDARLEKMTAAGIDTTTAASLHAEAEAAVLKAQADAQAVADYMASVEDSSDRTAVRTELQAKVRVAQESLKAAHTAVMDTVRALVQLAKNTDARVDADASVETDVQ